MKKAMICFVLACMPFATLYAHDPRNVTIENEVLSVSINPQGAELASIVAKGTGREFLWQGDSTHWGDRAPLMFPVNVRLKGDRYTYGDQSYVIPKMGLVIYRTFENGSSANANEAVFRLDANRDTLRYYPFAFRMQVAYRLQSNRIVNEFTIVNRDDKPMPFALGGHPGFAFPMADKNQREDFEYWFSKKLTADRNEIAGSLIQSKVIPFLQDESNLSFGDARIPDGGILMVAPAAREIGLARKGKQPFVSIDLGDFPNVNLWSPPGFPFACIEPMVGHHDSQDSPEAIEEKSCLIRLNPGESKTFRYTIAVFPERSP